jgi:hypothetical protein
MAALLAPSVSKHAPGATLLVPSECTPIISYSTPNRRSPPQEYNRLKEEAGVKTAKLVEERTSLAAHLEVGGTGWLVLTVALARGAYSM